MLSKICHQIAKKIPNHQMDIFGKDSLLMNCLPYYLLPFIIITAFAIFHTTDNPYIVLFILYSILPFMDTIFSLDTRNPDKKELQHLLQRGWEFQFPIYLTIAVDWAMFFYSLNYYSTHALTLSSAFTMLGLVFIIFNVNAAQFAVAHEIMHKPGWRRVIGTLHMYKTLNMHFTYEHVFGHHRKVATPEDPASAEKGINVYQFFIRSYLGAYKNVYEMEKQEGKNIFNNLMTWNIIANVVFCLCICNFYGGQAFVLFLLQVLGAVFYLEVINYIQHYGLKRKKLSDGTYQKINIRHSWNSPHRFSNYLFFKLQRHSDHHENAMKPYQILLTLDESPHLPHGYIVMTLTALFPSKFYSVMDPLVDYYNQTVDKTDAQMKALYENAQYEIKANVVQISLAVGALFFASQVHL